MELYVLIAVGAAVWQIPMKMEQEKRLVAVIPITISPLIMVVLMDMLPAFVMERLTVNGPVMISLET